MMRQSLFSKIGRACVFASVVALSQLPLVAFAVPVYLAPGHLFPSGNYNRDWLKEKTREQMMQAWFKVKTRSGKSGWIASEHLLTRETLKGGWLAYIKESVTIRSSPVLRSDILSQARAGEMLTLLQRPAPQGWIVVKRGDVSGFIPRNAVILASDINSGTALSLQSQLPVRAKSVPFADTVTKVEKFEEVSTLGTRSEAWGRVSLRSGGSVWWPMNDEVVAPGETKPQIQRLLTSELFQRKLYDMASSPLARNLKIASAGGIFRTTDGRQWTKLVQFRNENHPVAVSGLGRVFIGPYYSDDSGTTFNEYIRWDILIASLKQNWKLDGENIRLVEIHPSKKEINSVQLLLDVGLPHHVTVSTKDLGRSWHARSL